MFIAALFTTVKRWNQLKCPLTNDIWIDKMWDRHTTGYYSTLKNKEILPFATAWMNLENIVLSEILSKSQKDKYYMIPLT